MKMKMILNRESKRILSKEHAKGNSCDDSVYEYEKAIIDDLKQEDVSRYVDVDEETYEEVKKKMGGLHSAKIILYSVEFDEIEKCQSENKMGRKR